MQSLEVYMLFNGTTFIVTYSSGILAKKIGTAIEKIDEWLGKPVVITCDDVTTAQLPQVIEHACHITRVESVVFNTRLDEMKSDSNPNVHRYAGGPSVQGVVWYHLSEQIAWITTGFLVQREREKDTVRLEQQLHSISDARKTFNEQLVRAAINKSCVVDVADAICCLPPRSYFRWYHQKV